MCSRWSCYILAACATASPLQAQEESTAKNRIVSIGLFKNGLAVVKREIQVPSAGTYLLDATPEAVHGSFWIEANTKVEAAVRMRDVEVPLNAERGLHIQKDLAGKMVKIHFRNDKIASVTGTLLKLTKPPLPEGLLPGAPAYLEGSRGAESLLVLKTNTGRLYINPSDVLMVQTDDTDPKVVQRKPTLVLKVEKTDKKPLVFVSYLTHGIAWAPSYHVDISDPKTLAIEMATVIRNELADMQDAEIQLISGYPSVEFAHVTSPLSAHATWARFFQELQARPTDDTALLTQNAMFTNIKPVNYAPILRPGSKMGAIPEGEGVDLHFESIGKRTLLRDEALSLSVGKGKAAYQRLIDWTVGISPVARKSLATPLHQKNEMWDVLVFKNPFRFPLTTAPAMVVENGRFNGQRTIYWTNSGEETTLRITRSLSVRAISHEQEDGKFNERVVVDDKNYTKVFLKGELAVSNHRKQAVQMHIHHSIRGIIHEIEGDPRTVTREDTLEDVNHIHEVMWAVTLQPGEERKLRYRYSVLVYR